ncbi:MAG: MotA/TolQ/ExbB proton channel family protein [Oscillospiraceae bacterium]|nr:MotA/TolQ/ExbB proton channel family protein [Oscillospiraceae bacterium]
MDFISRFHIIEIWIILWTVTTAFFFYRCFAVSKTLRDVLQPRSRRANPDALKKDAPETPDDVRKLEDTIVMQRDRMNMWYSLAANFTTALPLWGMFGTVMSLIGLAGNLDGTEMPVDQFFTALYTTALGIVFGIGGKVADSFLSVKVVANNKETDTLLERNSQRQDAQEKAV